jgi:hypothetical protein
MNAMTKYFGNFEDRDSVMEEFSATSQEGSIPGFPIDDEILFASYTYASYEGYAVVVFKRDGSLYMVEGSHCSCYGLEGQWDPSQIDSAQLLAYTLDDNHDDEAQKAFSALAMSLNNVQG